MNFLKLFVISWPLYVTIDMFWLGLVMQSFYNTQFGSLKRAAFGVDGIVAGLVVWALLTLGIMIFILPQAKSVQEAVWYGVLYGMIVYGTYDLTNYATLTSWPLELLFVDWAWGCTVNGLMAGMIYWINTIV
ncbi:DUF2177 family protein [bacterium]|nr:DUF2177 family protein [bacterium]NBX77752.1 DUF2177 family protein [bacterium]